MYPLVIVRGGVNSGDYDSNGDPVDAGPPQRINVEAEKVAPRASMEPTQTQGRYGVIVGLSAYLPVGTVVYSTDLIEYRGPFGESPMELYEVEGQPGVWEDEGVEVSLRKAEG